ncbi:MAG: hypothetical protein ABEJ65_04995 [bacterium]
MKWAKAAGVGLIAALVMFIIMFVGIEVTGIAPFNMPPSQAFLQSMGIPPKPLGLIAHFGYGAFFSVVLVWIFRNDTTLGKGTGLSIVLWLGMMLGHSPLIGWGVFGMNAGNTASGVPVLESMPKYIVITLVLHLVYGAIIGGLNPLWVKFEEPEPDIGGVNEESE